MGIDFSGPLPGTPLLGQYKTKTSIDFTQVAWNTVANHRVFTVTGMVRAIVFYDVTGNLASGGGATISFGDTTAVANYSAAQAFGNLLATNFVVPALTIATVKQTGQFMDYTVSAYQSDSIYKGVNIGFAIAVAALTGGTIDAYCFWTPINDAGLVVPATGGAL